MNANVGVDRIVLSTSGLMVISNGTVESYSATPGSTIISRLIKSLATGFISAEEIGIRDPKFNGQGCYNGNSNCLM